MSSSLVLNRAQMSVSGTPGSSTTVGLGTAQSPYQSFSDAGATDGYPLTVLAMDGTAWEISTYVYSATGPSLTGRTLVASSTGSLLSLSSSAIVSAVESEQDLNTPPGEATWYPPLVSDFPTQVLGSNGGTMVQRPSGIWIAGTGNAGNNEVYALQNFPTAGATGWRVTMRGRNDCWGIWGNATLGIVFGDGATAQHDLFGAYVSGILYQNWPGYNDFGGNYSVSGPPMSRLDCWLKVEFITSGSVFNLYASPDGIDWTQTYSQTTPNFTYANIGPYWNNQGSNGAPVAAQAGLLGAKILSWQAEGF